MPDASQPLNPFQRLARQWDRAHPYNAAQLVELVGSAACQCTAEASWRKTLHAFHLGIATFNDRGNAARYADAPADDPHAVPRRWPAQSSPAAILTQLANEPFDEGGSPFRAFIIEGERSHHVGIVYQHWAADSVSVQQLVHAWVGAMRGDPIKPPVAAPPPRPSLPTLPGLWEDMRQYHRLRRARKIDSETIDDAGVAFCWMPAADGLITRMRSRTRAIGVKVQDVLLAAVIEACAAHVSTQPRANRPDIAVGSIVSTRRRGDRSISLQLGFEAFVVRPIAVQSWNRLLAGVARQRACRPQRHRGASWMHIAAAVGRHVPPNRLHHFYRKELPLIGGLSNVNLTGSWAGGDPRVVRYLRLSPAGPLAPVAIATTTLGEQFHLGITHRTALISTAVADQIGRAVLNRLAAFAYV